MGEDQNFEQRNVERPLFRNFKIANIKTTKDELFDNFIFEFNFSFFRPKVFNNFFILQIVEFYKIVNYSKLVNYYIIS